MDSASKKILAALVVLCVIGGGTYVALAALGPSETTTDARPRATAELARTDLMVRAVDPAKPQLNGHVFVVDHGKVETLHGSNLSCERVYFAAGRGICMGVAPSGVDYTAQVFDSKMQAIGSIPLSGLPSRARVSSDGRYGAMTVFVSGDAYLESSTAFSTRTYVVEMASGKAIGQLEQFSVSKDGKPIDAADFNFWGMTFDPSDSDRFYATLGTGDHHFLVEGSISGREMRVLRDGVECPSLSPDGRQIAFKSRIGHGNRWRLRVLDLSSLADHPVAEKRSIDDQAEWLDDDTLAYSDGRNVYTVPADGSGEAKLLVRDATSPVLLVGSAGTGGERN
jgi:WD40-like Beta Propeller Repeat